MVEAATTAGAIGSRMTGGGFGGCTINLVNSNNVDQFKQSVASEYAQATGREPEIYVCTTAQGAERVG
jgi:galactokinase